MTESARLWGGRFQEQTSERLEKLNSSIGLDKIMWREDIEGSIAYSQELLKVGILESGERDSLVKGLKEVASEWEKGSFLIKDGDEDIHTANERRLKELVGTVGGKLHTGRSRNDQVAVDMRMWLKTHIVQISKLLEQLIQVMLERAEKEDDVLMSGYTHLQQAQPIRWSHWVLSHTWALYHDLTKLKSVYQATDMCPLGSGALAGNPLGINRHSLATELGFGKPTPNSLLAVSDRDFVSDFLYWCCQVGNHLSKLAEDLILYCSVGFGFVTLSDAYSTGSSIMPQKKNPDSLELVRGKAGRLIGNLTGFLAVMKGLPSTYNKDIQEDKAALFDSADVVDAILQVTIGVMATLKVNGKKCESVLTEELLATDIAYYLVRKGIAFRDAHEMVGQVILASEKLNCKLSEVPLENLTKISSSFGPDVTSVWDFEHSVEQYSAYGGTARSSVKKQVEELQSGVKSFSLVAASHS